MKGIRLLTLCFGTLIFVAVCQFSCGSAPVKSKRPKVYPQAVLTMNKGVEWYEKGCYEKAMQLFWDAHEQFSALDSPGSVAASFNNIGNASRHLGEIEKAILFHEQALRIYRQLNKTDGQIKVFTDLAATQIIAGNLAAAESYLEQGERLAEKIEFESSSLLMTRGILLTHQKKYALAKKELLGLVKQIPTEEATFSGTLNSALGNLELVLGNLDAAMAYFQLALESDRHSGYFRGIADSLAELGHICIVKQEPQKGLFYLERSVKIYALLGVKDRVRSLSPKIESLAESTGQDMRLTLNLVNRWLSGEVHHSLCD